jgi:hypothetical protein
VDIYRSDNKLRNDYLYHNIGDELVFVNEAREKIASDSSSYPTLGKDYPGFRYFSDVRKLSGWKKNLIAVFHMQDENEKPVYMQVLVPGSENRTYFQAKSLKAKTAGRRYSGIEPPVFSMVDFKESASEPFVAVFEPYRNVDGYSVERISVEKRDDGLDFTSLNVYNHDGSRQHILQSPNPDLTFASGTAVFSGHLAVVDFSGRMVRSLYLGEGNEISCEGYSIVVPSGKGSASLTVNENSWTISSNQIIKVTLPARGKKFFLVDGEKKLTLPVTQTGKTVTFAVPKISNATITIGK